MFTHFSQNVISVVLGTCSAGTEPAFTHTIMLIGTGCDCIFIISLNSFKCFIKCPNTTDHGLLRIFFFYYNSYAAYTNTPGIILLKCSFGALKTSLLQIKVNCQKRSPHHWPPLTISPLPSSKTRVAVSKQNKEQQNPPPPQKKKRKEKIKQKAPTTFNISDSLSNLSCSR